MAIIRWNPWNLQDVFENDWDLPTIPGLSRLIGQGLNIYETEDEVVAEAAVPGIPEDNIDVTVEEGVVRISGSVEDKKEEKGKRKYYMTNMNRSFNYLFRLPAGMVAEGEPACELQDGVLSLHFAKAKKAPPKKIKVVKKAKEKK